jgi:hypothetical protein
VPVADCAKARSFSIHDRCKARRLMRGGELYQSAKAS